MDSLIIIAHIVIILAQFKHQFSPLVSGNTCYITVVAITNHICSSSLTLIVCV